MSRDGASLIGTVLAGKYRLDCILGAGGFGAVYRGWHLLLDVPIAVKVAFRVDGALGRRFQREARTLMTLRHPNIVRMYDYGQDPQGHVYMVQEFVDGRPLESVLATYGRLPAPAVIGIAVQVLGALQAAHDQGVVHRDIKPANVMLVGGIESPVVQLLDFGIAKMQGADGHELSDLTRPGGAPGTPSYMAPEQIHGNAEPASDLYALGGTMFRLLTGEKPFPYGMPKVLIAHLQDPVPELPDDVPVGLAEIVRRALAKAPGDRFVSADAMSRALLASGHPPADAAPDMSSDETARSVRLPWPLPFVEPSIEPGDASSTSAEGRGALLASVTPGSRLPVDRGRGIPVVRRWAPFLALLGLAAMIGVGAGLWSDAGAPTDGAAPSTAAATLGASDRSGRQDALVFTDPPDFEAAPPVDAGPVTEAAADVAPPIVDAGPRPVVARGRRRRVRPSTSAPTKPPPAVAPEPARRTRQELAFLAARNIERALHGCRCDVIPIQLENMMRLDAPAAAELRSRYTKKCVVVGMPGGCR